MMTDDTSPVPGLPTIPDPMQGLLGVLTQQYTTTPEAHKYATDLLDNALQFDAGDSNRQILERMQETAETSREALKTARAKLLGKKYDKSTDWLRLAAAFGSPTRTGSFGETLGGAAGAMADSRDRRHEFESKRDTGILNLDTALSGVDQSQLSNELALEQMSRRSRDTQIKSALSTLGKVPRVSPEVSSLQSSIEAVDRAYAKEYISFTGGMSADAAKSLTEIQGAVDALKGGNDWLTGPIVGSLSTLKIPWVGDVGKVAQDILWPEGSNVREIVESTVQRSLRPILGAQFTEKEGERLIARVYNPRLEERINGQRLERLLLQLKRAYKAKVEQAQYFQEHSTLRGYKGQVDWTVDDLWDPNDTGGQGTKEDMISVRMPDGEIFPVPQGSSRKEAIELYERFKKQPKQQKAKGGKVSRLLKKYGHKSKDDSDSRLLKGMTQKKKESIVESELRDAQRRGSKPFPALERVEGLSDAEALAEVEGISRVRKAGGGAVDLNELPEESTVSLDELRREKGFMEGADVDAIDIGLSAVGAATGYGVGKYGIAPGVSRLEEMLKGDIPRSTQGIERLLETVDIDNTDLREAGMETKRGLRRGVPEVLGDELGPTSKLLRERALISGGSRSEKVIDDLSARQQGSRERVEQRVNSSLKPYPYFERMDRLTSDLYENAKPLYETAYEKHAGIAEKDVPALQRIMDTPDGQRAVKIAIRLLRNEGREIGKKDAVGLVHKPSLRFLDYVKRGFDQIISTEESQGSTTLGRSMRSLRNQLRTQLDDIAPEYGEARNQYAGDLEVLDALQSGREEFHRMQPEEVKIYYEGMSTSEKSAYRTGIAQRIYEVINNPSTDINAAQRLIGSPAMRKRLLTVFERASEARLFQAALEKEVELFQSDKKLLGRVESGRRSRRMSEMMDAKARSPRLFSPVMLVMRLFTKPGVYLTEQQADEITDVMHKGTPKEIESAVDHLMPLHARLNFLKKRRGKLGIATAIAGALAAPFLNQEIDTED